jgi:radical SAM superfamily enzyme YgiQ (UPF0313 family)
MHFPHIGVGYLAAYLRDRGIASKVLDTSFDFDHRQGQIEKCLIEFRPDLVGITVYSSLVHEASDLVACVRKVAATPVVAGGPHISVTGSEFLTRTGIEFAIRQDGEVPLARLMAEVAKGPSDDGLSSIPGLIFRDSGGAVHEHPNTELIRDLDQIPFPDWSVFDLPKYSDWSRRCYGVVTSRGCPYGCTYCAAPLVTGRRFRTRSPGNVVDEIEKAAGEGFRRFAIADDAFNADLDRAKAICRLIIERRLNLVWDMGNGIRGDKVDREFFQLLRQAGCNFVGIGLESGNPEMLRRIRKGLTLEAVDRALAFAREFRIGTAVNVIIGHPGETWESAMDTLRVAERLPASYVNVYGLMPMKGTKAYAELKASEAQGEAKFFYDPDYYLSHFAAQGLEPVFETRDLSREQRRKLLVRGRNITKRRALEYRFGRVLGRLAYFVVHNDRAFTFANSLRNTRLGRTLYQKLRHED